MSFHTPKAIQNVGIFYCYTGQNMISQNIYFPAHYRQCSWLILCVMTYGQYKFISPYHRLTISKLPILIRLLFIVAGKNRIFLISFYQYHKRGYVSKTNVN